MDNGITRQVFFLLSGSSKFLFYILTLISLIIFFYGIIRFIKRIKRATSSPLRLSLKKGISLIFSNQSIIKDKILNGVSHLAIFWGFFLLFVGTFIIFINSDILDLISKSLNFFHGRFYLYFSFVMEIAGSLLILGILFFIFRRIFSRSKALDYKRMDRASNEYSRSSYIIGDWLFLGLLFFIGITGFILEAFRLNLEIEKFPLFSFVGFLISKALFPSKGFYHLLWWIHALAALFFISYIPYSKAFHIIADPFKLLLKRKEPYLLSSLQPEISEEEDHKLDFTDFTYDEVLNLEACTRCGRCHEICPATYTGLPLSPRELILDIRNFLRKKEGDIFIGEYEELLNTKKDELIDDIILSSSLWTCTTCLSCSEHCPALINHLPFVAKLRKELIDKGKVDPGIQEALENIAEEGNSFGESESTRGNWVDMLDFDLKDIGKEKADILWFVGDFASFDTRAKKVTIAFAKILHHAGIDFGIAFSKEKNSGGDVRTIGEEGLFEELKEENLKILSKKNFNLVVTTDPHSLVSLKRDYPEIKAKVMHSTQLLAELLKTKRIRLNQIKRNKKVSFHDPCYLGRYLNIYDAPREIINLLRFSLVELPLNKRNSFCCGGGGGGIWKQEEEKDKRLNYHRIKEALSLDIDYLIVACPKCLVMLEDALKGIQSKSNLIIKDIVELVEENLLV